jgi:O-antigen ligase
MSNLFNITLNKEYALSEKLFWFFAILSLLSIFTAIATDVLYLVIVPFAIIFFYLVVVDFRLIYYLLMLFVPLSIEVQLGSLGTDLPTEPLVVGLMLVFITQVAAKKNDNFEFYRHPIIWLLGLYYFWLLFSTAFSENFMVSFKQFLAKTWFITVFVFMTGQLNRTEKQIKTLFWVILAPNLFGIAWVLYHFKAYFFSFEYVNEAMSPFYRNHVNYAAILTLFFPFVFFAISWYKRFSIKWFFLIGTAVLFLVAIQLTYTRAAYAALGIAFGAFFIIRLKLTKYAIGSALILAVLGVMYVTNNNKYIDYAPDYHKAISHYEFDDLMSATAKFEDVSTMERVYRWVAGYQMIDEYPITGFGPGNFYNFYKGYSVGMFRTYVSNNIDKSGVHNYYLMTLVEQGFPGLLIFLILAFGILLKGEQIYHQTDINNKTRRNMIMAILLSMIIIYAFLLINDLLEAAKVGSFFFINLALLINLDLMNKKDKEALEANN